VILYAIETDCVKTGCHRSLVETGKKSDRMASC